MANDLVQQKAKTLQALLEVSKKQIEAALPRHMTPDRLLRIAMTEARKNPVLLECTQASFIGAIIQTAQLGLEPGGALGHSYLVPFKNKKQGIMEVQFIVGYRGMMDLAYRSPKVSHIIARAVYEGDKFEYGYGLEEKLIHVPDPEASGTRLTHVYAILFLKEGGKIFDVMEIKEIEAARARSKASESGPWVSDFEAMAKKSVVRRMFRFMPVSIELQTAVGLDEAGERGDQENGMVIDITEPKTKTEQFKEALEARDPKDEPNDETSAEVDPDGDFAKFGTEPEPEPPKTAAKTRGQMVKEMLEHSKRLGWQVAKLTAEAKRKSGKEPEKMSDKEMAEFNQYLSGQTGVKP